MGLYYTFSPIFWKTEHLIPLLVNVDRKCRHPWRENTNWGELSGPLKGIKWAVHVNFFLSIFVLLHSLLMKRKRGNAVVDDEGPKRLKQETQLVKDCWMSFFLILFDINSKWRFLLTNGATEITVQDGFRSTAYIGRSSVICWEPNGPRT